MTILGTMALNINFYRKGYLDEEEEKFTDDVSYIWGALTPLLIYLLIITLLTIFAIKQVNT